MLDCLMGRAAAAAQVKQQALDEARMQGLVRYTMRSMRTSTPTPFGALIVETISGAHLMRGVNAVRRENDPSSHAEVRTVRKATRLRKDPSLRGHTLYSTCEPCPMCMANALWAGLDRVVYGATIEDASRHCGQIHIAAREVAERADMRCAVEGPVLRDACYELFTHPEMLKAFAAWKKSAAPARRRP